MAGIATTESTLTAAAPTDSISHAFVSARLGGRALDGFPGALPSTLAAAYGVQETSIMAWPDAVAGWKVGGIPAPFGARFGADRLAGPIFASSVRGADGKPAMMPAYEGGFAAIEAEFVLVTNRDIAPGSPVGDPRDLVGAVHVGVEIASSPLSVINDLGPLCIISDFGNNAGLLVGPAIEDWRATDLSAIPVDVEIDGETVGSASANRDAPFEALAFLVDLSAQRGLTLPSGTMVSTGAITGVHQTSVGARSSVRFGGIADLRLELVPAAARG